VRLSGLAGREEAAFQVGEDALKDRCLGYRICQREVLDGPADQARA